MRDVVYMYLEDKAAEDFCDVERIEWDSWGRPTDWKAFTENVGEKCRASAVRSRDIVSELKHREMWTGESISSYYAAVIKIVAKFSRGQTSPAH